MLQGGGALGKENLFPGLAKWESLQENDKTATDILFKMPQKSFEEFLARQTILPETVEDRDQFGNKELRDWAESVGLL